MSEQIRIGTLERPPVGTLRTMIARFGGLDKWGKRDDGRQTADDDGWKVAGLQVGKVERRPSRAGLGRCSAHAQGRRRGLWCAAWGVGQAQDGEIPRQARNDGGTADPSATLLSTRSLGSTSSAMLSRSPEATSLLSTFLETAGTGDGRSCGARDEGTLAVRWSSRSRLLVFTEGEGIPSSLD